MIQAVVGKSVAGWCGRCKLMLAHTIEAIVNNKITRAHCNTCGGQHALRANPPGKGGTKARGSSSGRSTRAASAVVDYRAVLQNADVANARQYRMSERFQAKEIIVHPVFGVGLVLGVRDANKIDVGFTDGMKTLAGGTGS